MKRTGVYMIEYGMDGSRWTIDVHAESAEEAKRRLAIASQFGEVLNPDGVSYSMPVALGWWVPAWVWLRNTLKI